MHTESRTWRCLIELMCKEGWLMWVMGGLWCWRCVVGSVVGKECAMCIKEMLEREWVGTVRMFMLVEGKMCIGVLGSM